LPDDESQEFPFFNGAIQPVFERPHSVSRAGYIVKLAIHTAVRHLQAPRRTGLWRGCAEMLVEEDGNFPSLKLPMEQF
jgi:hypothetical protein